MDAPHMFLLLRSLSRNKRKHISLFNSYSNGTAAWKVLFYGTDELSECTLKALDQNRLLSGSDRVVQSLDIVCKQSDCAVRQYATSRNFTIYTWPFDVPPGIYDVGVLVSFGHMIPSSSILACKYGIINAHPSLLPRWRGAAPIFYSILNGDSETGVTITEVSPNRFDIGKILMQERYPIPKSCTARKLSDDLGKLAANMVVKTLQNLLYYIEKSYPQPKEGGSLARKIKPNKCYINWEEDTTIIIDQKFRAFYSYFDLFTFWKGSKVTILEIVPPEEEVKMHSLVPDPVLCGYCYFHKKRKIIFVKCNNGWTGIKKIKIPKRGKISAQDFYNGFMSKEDPSKCYFTTTVSE